MRRTILLYALLMAVLTAFLKFIEFQYLVRDLSIEFYIGVIALMFSAIGVWAGLKLTRRRQIVVAPLGESFVLNQSNLDALGISKREHEVLTLMAQGLTNQQIADKLFVSLNTVKTHLSNLFQKLEVSRRTQAVQRAKELQLIP
jgi:two-component system, NarL family, response regulator LiaR